MGVIMISSMTNQRVKQVIRWQKKSRERNHDKIFLAEGFKMFEEAGEDMIREVYLSESSLDKVNADQGLRDKLRVTGYELVSGDVFLKMADTQTPQGIITVIRQPEYTLDTLLNIFNPLFLILEDLQDPGNLGTIIRTAEGAGITGLIMSKHTVDIFNPKTIRSTMGSIYRVPFVYVQDLEEAVMSLHNAGVDVYAAHLEGEAFYHQLSYMSPTAFMIGNESAGLSIKTAQLADFYLKIPMAGQVESLNAAIAASLLMYEAYRQRHC